MFDCGDLQGTEIRLRCEVREGPLHHTSLVWTFRPARPPSDKEEVEEVVLNQDTQRGGVMISTWWEEETDSLVSELTLYRASLQDKGDYVCRLPGSLAGLGNSSVATVHILNTTLTEPVQVTVETSHWSAYLQILGSHWWTVYDACAKLRAITNT